MLLLFHFALSEGGVLMLGGSETVGSLDDRFEPISKTQRIYRQIGRSRPGEVDFPIGCGRRRASDLAGSAAPGSRAGHQPWRSDAPAADRDLCAGFGPDQSQVRVPLLLGPDRPLFAGGRGRAQPRSARHGARGPAQKARCGDPAGEPGARARDRYRRAGEPRRQRASRSASRSIRVQQRRRGACCWSASSTNPSARQRPDRPAEPADDLSRVAELERELDATRKELQSAIHDLEIANEEQKAINQEAMSANEEFQSTNEELMTSREELQSLNEELTALNSQLQETLERQRSTSNDLQNILDSSGVATLFLDGALNIRFFTPAAKSLFRVIATDIGRPLADLTPLAADRDLLADARAVLTSLAPLGREIEAEGGAWYVRRILPYRTQDNRIDGVVITFADISEIKAAEREIRAARAYSDSIIDTIRQPLVVLDEELRVVSANRSFYRIFALAPEETVGRMLGLAGDWPPGNSGAARLPRSGPGRARSGRGLRGRDRAPAARAPAPAAERPRNPRWAAGRTQDPAGDRRHHRTQAGDRGVGSRQAGGRAGQSRQVAIPCRRQP